MTPQQLIKDAMLELAILQAGEDPSADEAADCLRRFNAMLHGKNLLGVDLFYEDATLTEELSFPEDHYTSFYMLLAKNIAPMFGRPIAKSTVDEINKAERSLKNYYLEIGKLEADEMLDPYYNPNQYYNLI